MGTQTWKCAMTRGWLMAPDFIEQVAGGAGRGSSSGHWALPRTGCSGSLGYHLGPELVAVAGTWPCQTQVGGSWPHGNGRQGFQSVEAPRAWSLVHTGLNNWKKSQKDRPQPRDGATRSPQMMSARSPPDPCRLDARLCHTTWAFVVSKIGQKSWRAHLVSWFHP